MALFDEGQDIQNHIMSSRHPYSCCDDEHHSGRFARSMMNRNCYKMFGSCL